MRRLWCGPEDPDPTIVQIGAVRLGLDDLAILDTATILVRPVDRYGQSCRLDSYLSELTGISNSLVQSSGVDLSRALETLEEFSCGGRLWSWGKDELNVAISCFVAGIQLPLAANRFSNARKLLLKAGMAHEDIENISSGELASFYGVGPPSLRAHDALDDALSVAHVLRHFLEMGLLVKSDFL